MSKISSVSPSARLAGVAAGGTQGTCPTDSGVAKLVRSVWTVCSTPSKWSQVCAVSALGAVCLVYTSARAAEHNVLRSIAQLQDPPCAE